MQEYLRWVESAAADKTLAADLLSMKDDEKKREDAFFRALEFGTGGLRGVLGAGTNRMNIYTVARATAGIAAYLDKSGAKGGVAIGCDTRNMSREFAEVTASVLAEAGRKVYLFSTALPTPVLSFATRELGCAAGIMITASHNPAEYNGYKVYGADGCQITEEVADGVIREINALDYFDVNGIYSFKKHLERGAVEYIKEELLESFLKVVSSLSLLGGDRADKSIKIVYTPLNGTGFVPVTRILELNGYNNVTVVAEQATPDGNFPTCPYPNPEIPAALTLGLKYAKELDADFLIATDPDCDRVGVAIKEAGEFKILTGNEVGILLLEYVIKRRKALGLMPKSAVAVKTIVTTGLASAIAKDYGVELRDVLTGFKYIGETIGELEANDRLSDYVFGFEESCGYLSGAHARDKDGVNAAHLVCEMFAYYKAQGISPADAINRIYDRYGYAKNSLYSYGFGGADGFAHMQQIMQNLRGELTEFGGIKIINSLDYKKGICGLPKSDVMSFKLEGDASFIVRPSGTEPKIKIYIEVIAEDRAHAAEVTEIIKSAFEEFIK